MDHQWAVAQLQVFVLKIDLMAKAEEKWRATEGEEPGNKDSLADELISLEPVMRRLMNAAQQGFGNYSSSDNELISHSPYWSDYWVQIVKPWALRARGIHSLGAEAHQRMRPDAPVLAADQLHPWVWQPAASLWEAENRQEAIHAAARSVNAHLQQKVGRWDIGESKLCRESFSPDPAREGHPRLRFPGNQSSATWRGRQIGAIDFGSGCFEAFRNPAAHEHKLDLTEQVALEQLAAFSQLARMIEECLLESPQSES